ncbi:MAG: alcohol dehydrogenase catalytic domain-containing protein [Desulfobia sp.]
MKALYLQNGKIFFLEDTAIPEPREDEALIRVRLAGICGTDLELVKGYYPFTGIPGHEFVGEVVKASSEPSLTGRRVVGEINCVCFSCSFCRQGLYSHCRERTVAGIKGRQGCFGQYLSLPVANLHPVPENVSDEEAVFVEPLAAALRIQEQLRIRPSDKILIVGSGRLGQLIARTLVLIGCEISAVTRHKKQSDLLSDLSVFPLVESEVEKEWADIVVEASGTVSGFSLARRAVRPGGVIVLKTTCRDECQLNLSSLVVDEISLIGSRCGPFPPALRLLAGKMVDPRPLIQQRFRLDEGEQAFARAARPGTLKVLLDPA